MSELPTAIEPHAKPEVARALADIEAAKLAVGQDVAECLDAVGDLIRITGTPKTLDWVMDFLGREHLRVFAAQNGLTVHESRALDEDLLNRTAVLWMADGKGLALVPTGQAPATTLLRLREEVAQRAEDVQRAIDFQASAAAGHVEDVDAWYARTSKAAR